MGLGASDSVMPSGDRFDAPTIHRECGASRLACLRSRWWAPCCQCGWKEMVSMPQGRHFGPMKFQVAAVNPALGSLPLSLSLSLSLCISFYLSLSLARSRCFLPLLRSSSVALYVYLHISTSMYLCIYRERGERERERDESVHYGHRVAFECECAYVSARVCDRFPLRRANGMWYVD